MDKRTPGGPGSSSSAGVPTTAGTPQHQRTGASAYGDLPGLDELLTLATEGDQASFAAFYDSTAPWVYGLASTMFASDSDAFEATALTYLQVWEQAGEPQFDDDTPAARHRAVLSWLQVLAHQTMTSLLRHDSLPGVGDGLLPDRAGPAPLGEREQLGPLEALTPAQFAALDAAWSGGRTYRQVAEELGVAVPTVKSRLRDAVQRISHRYQEKFLGRVQEQDPVMMRAVTPEIAARTGRTRNFTLDLAQDVENGLGRELADVAALDALDRDELFTLEGAVDRQGPENATLWRARLETARRTVTWAFKSQATEPPSDLLEDLLLRLPAQDVGMGLVDGLGPSAPKDQEGPTPEKNRPLKKWMLVVAGLLVLALGLFMVWRLIVGPDVVATVDRAEDSFTTQDYQLTDGGVMQGHVSKERDMAYVTFSGMPDPGAGHEYQLWLHPADGSSPASLGTYGLDDLQDPVTFRGLSGYQDLTVTVEPDGGSEAPTTQALGSLDLVHQVTRGLQYGGHPNSTPSAPNSTPAEGSD